MYQINSDSEGDEGSDIVPEEDEGSQSDDDASGADNGGAPGMDDVEPEGESTEAAGVEQHGDELASSSRPKLCKGEQCPLSKQQESNAGVASSRQHSADSQHRGQAAAVETQALEQTLPYEAGPSSLPSQQTLLYHCASDTQRSSGSHTQQAGSTVVDLTHAEAAQELPESAGLHATPHQEDAPAQQRIRAVATASTIASPPTQGPILGSPITPLSGSAKKQKQADIRGFLSPQAVRR